MHNWNIPIRLTLLRDYIQVQGYKQSQDTGEAGRPQASVLLSHILTSWACIPLSR